MAVYETCACAAGSVLLKNKKTTIHHGGPKTLPLDAAKLKKVPPPPPPPLPLPLPLPLVLMVMVMWCTSNGCEVVISFVSFNFCTVMLLRWYS